MKGKLTCSGSRRSSILAGAGAGAASSMLLDGGSAPSLFCFFFLVFLLLSVSILPPSLFCLLFLKVVVLLSMVAQGSSCGGGEEGRRWWCCHRLGQLLQCNGHSSSISSSFVFLFLPCLYFYSSSQNVILCVSPGCPSSSFVPSISVPCPPTFLKILLLPLNLSLCFTFFVSFSL